MSYRIGVDIGGTFTDCVVVDAAGQRTISKSLTTHGALSDGVIDAVTVNAVERGRSQLELLTDTTQFVHGTTEATNDVITRRDRTSGVSGKRVDLGGRRRLKKKKNTQHYTDRRDVKHDL